MGILLIVIILLGGAGYSIELPWPNNVPLGTSFHETLYTDIIDDAIYIILFVLVEVVVTLYHLI